jgi:hypothetical protein
MNARGRGTTEEMLIVEVRWWWLRWHTSTAGLKGMSVAGHERDILLARLLHLRAGLEMILLNSFSSSSSLTQSSLSVRTLASLI